MKRRHDVPEDDSLVDRAREALKSAQRDREQSIDRFREAAWIGALAREMRKRNHFGEMFRDALD